jgi:hypothetical protein
MYSKAGLELAIFLPQLPKCWDPRQAWSTTPSLKLTSFFTFYFRFLNYKMLVLAVLIS